MEDLSKHLVFAGNDATTPAQEADSTSLTANMAQDEMAKTPAGPPDGAHAWAIDWGRLLRTARQVSGISLTELSEATGLSKGYLSKLESGANGAVNPSRTTLAALARTLPSFRPLAHTLEPGMGAVGLDYSGLLGTLPAATERQAVERAESGSVTPIQLGWRELEVYGALLTLEATAIPLRITLPVLARATGRAIPIVKATLDHLVEHHLVVADLPARMGDQAAYRCAEDGLARIGVARLGDFLVLAAALIAGAPIAQSPPHAGGPHGHGFAPDSKSPEGQRSAHSASVLKREGGAGL